MTALSLAANAAAERFIRHGAIDAAHSLQALVGRVSYCVREHGVDHQDCVEPPESLESRCEACGTLLHMGNGAGIASACPCCGTPVERVAL